MYCTKLLFSPRRVGAGTAALLLSVALLLAGCGEDAPEPEPSSETSAQVTSPPASKVAKAPTKAAGETLAITVSGDQVTPSGKAVEMSVGDVLSLRITSDRAGELHVHSRPEQEVSFRSGDTRRDLTFDKPGQVDVEEHESGSLVARLLVQ